MAKFSDIIEGLIIFQKCLPPGAHLGGADHDIIYAAPEDTVVSEEDKKKLEELNWNCGEDDGGDCSGWYHFV